MYYTFVPSGPYQGFIVESLPDSVLETLWQELDGDKIGTPDESRVYSEEEKRLLEAIVAQTVDRWHQRGKPFLL